jgi:Fe-S-cluster-containing dehydrogenase component
VSECGQRASFNRAVGTSETDGQICVGNRTCTSHDACIYIYDASPLGFMLKEARLRCLLRRSQCEGG